MWKHKNELDICQFLSGKQTCMPAVCRACALPHSVISRREALKQIWSLPIELKGIGFALPLRAEPTVLVAAAAPTGTSFMRYPCRPQLSCFPRLELVLWALALLGCTFVLHLMSSVLSLLSGMLSLPTSANERFPITLQQPRISCFPRTDDADVKTQLITESRRTYKHSWPCRSLPDVRETGYRIPAVDP